MKILSIFLILAIFLTSFNFSFAKVYSNMEDVDATTDTAIDTMSLYDVICQLPNSLKSSLNLTSKSAICDNSNGKYYSLVGYDAYQAYARIDCD